MPEYTVTLMVEVSVDVFAENEKQAVEFAKQQVRGINACVDSVLDVEELC